MMTGVALIPTGPRYIPYGWVFVVVVIVLIALIFIRVYGRGAQSRRRTAHRASHRPERGGNHGHRAVSRRRPNRH